MSKPLMTVVLPRLARPLFRQLERYWVGELTDKQFTRRFEALLQRQHSWLARHGISDIRAALAIHAALIVLSLSGLRAEAQSEGVPLEVVENRAVQEAADDLEQNYGMNRRRAADIIARVVVKYAE